MRIVIRPRIVQVIQQEVVRYECDRCGKVCGTKENNKETWYAHGKALHYCRKTCSPRDHSKYDINHVVNCELCYRDADKSDPRISEAVLAALR